MQFYQELQKSVLNESSEKPEGKDIDTEPKSPKGGLSEASADPCVILMECGSNCMERYAAKSPSDFMAFTNCATSSDLLGSLRDILDNKSKWIQSNLNTLVIENISAFYWHQKSVNSRELYKDLNMLIGEMMKRYACNVIVTMWGVMFERGFNSHTVDSIPQNIYQATFTPHELFKGASIAFFNKRKIEI